MTWLENRVRDAFVFEVTGVNLAGPLYLKEEKKLCILLFTYAVYCAVHFELVTSLSTNSFMLGLKRFVARCDQLKVMYSDNGTNCVKIEDLFKSLNCTKITREASIFRIQWKYNPATVTWWGGWWDQVIQMVKKLLKRVLGTASLKNEELLTILCNTDVVINLRPLTSLKVPRNCPLSPLCSFKIFQPQTYLTWIMSPSSSSTSKNCEKTYGKDSEMSTCVFWFSSRRRIKGHRK